MWCYVILLLPALAGLLPAQLCGDVDESGAVGVLDALRVAQHAAGLVSFTPVQAQVADIDASGFVSVVDALRIAQAAAGIAPVTCTRPVGEWQDVSHASSLYPSARLGHACCADPVRNRAIVFGGWAGPAVGRRNDTYAFDLATAEWTMLFPAGVVPSERVGHGLVLDPGRDRMLMLQGDCGLGQADGQVYALDFSTTAGAASGGRGEWVVLPATGPAPAPRHDFGLSFDVAADGLVLHAGQDDSGLFNRDDLWLLDFSAGAEGTWRQLTQTGDVPWAPDQHSLTYIPDRGVHVMFGGYDASGLVRRDLYELEIRPSQGVGVWRRMTPGGMVCSARAQHQAVYDPVRRWLIFAGGTIDNMWIEYVDLSGGGDGIGFYHIILNGVAPALRLHPAAFLDDQGALVLHGGADGYSGALLADTWRILVP